MRRFDRYDSWWMPRRPPAAVIRRVLGRIRREGPLESAEFRSEVGGSGPWWGWKDEKMALELLLSDHAGDCIAPCSAGCPAGLDVSAYVYELASGHVDRSMEVIYDKLSLPGTLGRVCPRLCEQSCKRCDHDGEGLAIASLHRYATDRNQTSPARVEPQAGEATGKSVAIVGAGPAGLACADVLVRNGVAVTVYDAYPEIGGLLSFGIPEFKLESAVIRRRRAILEGMGIEFVLDTRVGTDLPFARLLQQYDAVFLGLGMYRGIRGGFPGDSHGQQQKCSARDPAEHVFTIDTLISEYLHDNLPQ